VVREYIGAGETAALIAQHDQMERAERQAVVARWRQQKAEGERLDAQVDEFCRLADAAARALLLAAGYHLHRGQWRKRRGTQEA